MNNGSGDEGSIPPADLDVDVGKVSLSLKRAAVGDGKGPFELGATELALLPLRDEWDVSPVSSSVSSASGRI